MRSKSGLAGATLLYGNRRGRPDLAIVVQLLLDDLRARERRLGGLRMTPASLRLRLEGFELAMSLVPGPLPPAAFDGLRRPDPVPISAGVPGAAPQPQVNAVRTRILHVLRRHGWALGVLLRRRGRMPAGADADPAAALIAECRALLAPVIEAAPPDLVLWHPEALALTPAEFAALPVEALPGNPLAAALTRLSLPCPGARPAVRPAVTAVPHAAKAPPHPSATTDRPCRMGRPPAGGGRAGEGRGLPALAGEDLHLARALRAAAPEPPPGASRPARLVVAGAALVLPVLAVLIL